MTNNPSKFDAVKYQQITLPRWNNATEACNEIDEAAGQFDANDEIEGSCEMLGPLGTKLNYLDAAALCVALNMRIIK